MTRAAAALLGGGLLLWIAGAADAQAASQVGGKPPAAVKTQLCSISSVFAKLNSIKHNKECLKGCSKVKGKCPNDWYPGKAVRSLCLSLTLSFLVPWLVVVRCAYDVRL